MDTGLTHRLQLKGWKSKSRQKRDSVRGENIEKYEKEFSVISTKTEWSFLIDYVHDVSFSHP